MSVRLWRTDWPTGTFLAGLSAADVDALLAAGAERVFTDREVIVAEGVPGSEVYLIVRGFAKVVSHTPSGGVALLAIRIAGDIIGELSAVDGRGRLSTVTAAGRVEARVVDGPLFLRLERERPEIATAVQRTISSKLRAASHLRADAGPAETFVRVVRALVRLVETYGRPVTQGLVIDVPMAQADLARLIGISTPSATRALRVLRGRGVLSTAYRRIVVRDVDRLKLIALEGE